MSCLRVYGDSFAAPEVDQKTWPTLLADQLYMHLDNKAVKGSSTEYAIKTLTTDLHNGVIKKGDVIIYVPSHTGRLHFTYQKDHPETASNYLHDPNLTLEGEHPWYWNNKHHIEWWLLNCDDQLLKLNHEAYIQLIKNYALARPDCTFLVLPAFQTQTNIMNGTAPENFLRAEINFYKISHDEVGDNFDYFNWIEFTKEDPRANHLTLPNLKLLADLLETAILKKNVSNITYKQFKTRNISKITTKKQYQTYIDKGILDCNTKILANLPG